MPHRETYGRDEGAPYRLLQRVYDEVKKMRAEISRMLDEVRQTRTVIGSIRQYQQATQASLDELKAKIANADSLSDEDKQALTQAADELHEINQQAASAIPQNTEQGGGGAAQQPSTGGQAPATDNNTGTANTGGPANDPQALPNA